MNKLFIILSVLAISGCGQINPGEVGFKTTWGKIDSDYVLHEGLWFYSPIGGDLVTYDVKNQNIKIKTEQYTRDIQQCYIEVAVTFSLNPDKVIELHKKTGRSYKDKIIIPSCLGSIKDVMGKWEAQDIIAKREEATGLIYKDLKAKMQSYGIDVSFIEILDITFTDVFERAVEAKQVAMQDAIAARNKTIRIEEESKQKIISAKAEAESMSVRASALEKNKSLVEYEAVQRWDGKLPVYMLGNSTPFFNIGNISGKDK